MSTPNLRKKRLDMHAASAYPRDMTTIKQYNVETIYQGVHVTVTKRVRIMRVWITYYKKVL